MRYFNLKPAKVILFVFIGILIGCTPNAENEYEIKWEQFMNNIEKTQIDITEKYNIKYDWDSLRYDYTIQYDNVLSSGYQMVSRFDVHDIYIKEESTYLSIFVNSKYHQNFQFDLYVPDEAISISDLVKMGELRRSRTLMVVRIDQIKKFSLNLETHLGDNSAYTSYEASDIFFGTGELIELTTINE